MKSFFRVLACVIPIQVYKFVLTRSRPSTGSGRTVFGYARLVSGFGIACLALPGGIWASDGDGCNCNSQRRHEYATIFIPRAAGADNMVLNAHWLGYRALCDECMYVQLRANYEFAQNFHGNRIARGLFDTDELLFQGSDITGDARDSRALLADYFGLSTATNNTLGLSPRIRNNTLDFNLFFGLGPILDGLYLQIDLPVVHSSWHLHQYTPKNAPAALPSKAFLPGYMDDMFGAAPYTVENLNPVTPFTNFTDALNGVGFGNVTPWTYGKFFEGKHDATKLAAVNMDLGYNFYECPDYHIGIYARVAAPTGTKIDNHHAEQVFAPTIGDDHWKAGAGLTAHAELYNCDDDHIVTAYFQGYVVHMFSRNQTRSFDFLGAGRLSRYMLLKEFGTDNFATGKVINAIDYTTRRAKVSVDVQGEAILEFGYKGCSGFTAGIGYNIYGKTREELSLRHEKLPIDSSNWGYKGISWTQVGGFKTKLTPSEQFDLVPVAAEAVHYLGATQGDATIYSATSTTNTPLPLQVLATAGPAVSGIVYLQGIASDNFPANNDPAPGAFIITDESGIGAPLAIDGAGTDIDWATFTPEPEFITTDRLDVQSGRAPHQVTNKIYGHLGYQWRDCDWTPFVRAGAEGEFASDCDTHSMEAWAVFVTGGISF